LLVSLRALTGQYLRQFSLSEERIQEVVLAVDEACSNAIRHAYNNQPNEELTLSFRDKGAFLEVAVADWGRPMPASALARSKGKDKKASAKTVRPGGLGLKLMHHIFDEVHITTGEKRGNRVRMRLYL
jgi:serine/threonine-protein kinase RsbW